MRELQAPPALEDVLRLGAASARDWTRRARTRQQDVPGRFNWLGLAEGAALNARLHAEKVQAPLGQFSRQQREVLRAALVDERLDLPGDDQYFALWVREAVPALQWAQVAIAAYDLLIGKTASRERRGYQDSVMNLRAFLISRLGAIPGDRVLDADDIVFYFFDGLDRTPDDARKEALAFGQHLRDRTHTPRLIRDIRHLRGIRNRLAPVALVVESGQLETTPALQSWLDLREDLP